MKIDYTRDAIRDLVRLREFIAEKNPFAADRYAKLIKTGILRLADQPRLGYGVNRAPEPENIRDLVIGDYIARYLLTDDRIVILRIWHHRENWKTE